MQRATPNKIIGVQVFLERRSTRLLVGVLRKEEKTFCFEYDKNYVQARNVIPLGPEMPLSRRLYRSETLFTPFNEKVEIYQQRKILAKEDIRALSATEKELKACTERVERKNSRWDG